jgi:hypothetical protein
MAGTRKINKAKKAAKETVQINSYEAIAGDDGNPNTPAAFDADEVYDGELFFKADDDAEQVRTPTLLCCTACYSLPSSTQLPCAFPHLRRACRSR